MLLGVGPGAAQEGVELPLAIDYEIRYLGVEIGSGRLTGTLGPDRYDLSVDYGFKGVGRWVAGEGGAVRSSGRTVGGELRPDGYFTRRDGKRETRTVSVAFEDGEATRIFVLPVRHPDEIDEDERRAPLEPEHLKGVADPLSVLLHPAPRGTPAATLCDTRKRLFSGIVRFDLVAEPAPPDAAPPDPDLVLCNVRYRPLGGYLLSYEEKRDGDELHRVWFKRLPGTELFVPARIELDAAVGSLVVEARELLDGAPLYAAEKLRDRETRHTRFTLGSSR